MAKRITTKKLAGNVILSIFVQAISLAVGFLLNLIVPKFIDQYQYSYWQVYVLYVSYVGVLHFGLLDGLVLRYSQYDYEELDKRKVRSQFIILFTALSIMTFTSLLVAFFAMSGPYRWIVAFIGLGILSKNIFTYSQYTFQITNRIPKYAIVVIVQRVTYGLIVALLLILKVNNFIYYCLADIVGDTFAVLLGSIFNRGMYFGKTISFKEAFKEVKHNVFSGILLMFANFSAALITGSARMIIQGHWNELMFGKVSFAFSLTHVFLTFVTAISVVLFPSLKRLKEEDLPELYKKIRDPISILLISVMIAYFPGCWILNKWLPKYSESLVYLGYLLPLIIFSSKVTLLTNNYLKVYRKEFQMMIINVSSVAFGVLLSSLSAFVFDNIILVVCSIMITIMVNSIASECMVMHTIKKRFIIDFIIELVMVIVFVVAATQMSLLYGMLTYLGALLVYLILYRKTIISYFGHFKKFVNKSGQNNVEKDNIAQSEMANKENIDKEEGVS